jgi:hypothetical protein
MEEIPFVLIAGIAVGVLVVVLLILRRRGEERLAAMPHITYEELKRPRTSSPAREPAAPQASPSSGLPLGGEGMAGSSKMPSQPMFSAQGSRLVIRHPMVRTAVQRALAARPEASRYLSHDGEQVVVDIEALPFRNEAERERARGILARLEGGQSEPDLTDIMWIGRLLASE